MTREHRPFAFFGTPALACEILDALEKAGYVPALVVSMPDKPHGRGLQVQPSPVSAWAQERGIEVLKPEKLDPASVQAIAARGLGFAIVVAYGKIVPQTLLDAFPLGMFNIHYSLLPRWRGATPVESAILAGERETGVCIQRMVFALDAGPIAALERTPIGPSESTPELRARLNAIAADALVRLMPQIAAGSVALTQQDDSMATRCGKMEKSDGDITHDDDTMRYRKYRAYAAWPGTFFFSERGGQPIRVKVKEAHAEGARFVLDTVVPEGKGPQPYATFLQSGAEPLRQGRYT